jgi:hypothetical protein
MLHAFLGSESTMKTAMILPSEEKALAQWLWGDLSGEDMLV